MNIIKNRYVKLTNQLSFKTGFLKLGKLHFRVYMREFQENMHYNITRATSRDGNIFK